MALLLRPVFIPKKRTAWPAWGHQAIPARILTEAVAVVSDYPNQILLEDNNRILLEQ